MNSPNDVDTMIISLLPVETRRLERLSSFPKVTQAARGCGTHNGGTTQKLLSSPLSLPSFLAGRLKGSPSQPPLLLGSSPQHNFGQ